MELPCNFGWGIGTLGYETALCREEPRKNYIIFSEVCYTGILYLRWRMIHDTKSILLFPAFGGCRSWILPPLGKFFICDL